VPREKRRRRRGPAESEAQEVPKAPAYIKRKIPHYSILSDDELSVIEENADTISQRSSEIELRNNELKVAKSARNAAWVASIAAVVSVIMAIVAINMAAQPIIGFNPNPEVYDGVLLPYSLIQEKQFTRMLNGDFNSTKVTMAKATFSDGQEDPGTNQATGHRATRCLPQDSQSGRRDSRPVTRRP